MMSPRTGTVTFLAGESSNSLTVKVFGDAIEEPDEAFHVTLTGATSGPAVLGTAMADGTITNDDVTATVSISNAQVVEGNTGTKNIVFTVTLLPAGDRHGQAELRDVGWHGAQWGG